MIGTSGLLAAIVPTLVVGASAPAAASAATTRGNGAVATSGATVPVVPVRDHGAQARALGWSLVFAGATFGVLGGTAILVGQLNVEARDASNRDDLTGWRGVRAAGFVSCGVGAVLATAGVFRLLTAPRPMRGSAFVREVRLAAAPGFVGLAGRF